MHDKTGHSAARCLLETCVCVRIYVAADVDDITVILDVKDHHKLSSHYYHSESSPASGVSDVSTAINVPRDADSSDSVTDDTAAHVSTKFRRRSDDSHAVSQTRSPVEPSPLDVEPSSPDDRTDSQQQHVDSNRAAIDLLLWKLTELERRITLGQVRYVPQCVYRPMRCPCFLTLIKVTKVKGTGVF